jgi:hypothetical protein
MSSISSDLSSATTRDELELLELKLRIRDLKTPWWQKPAVLAPSATITAAILGLIWAVASGFFDVSRRELAVSKRDLELQTREIKENRDRQSLIFRSAMTARAKELAKLQDKEKSARSEVARLVSETQRQSLMFRFAITAQAEKLANLQVKEKLAHSEVGSLLSETQHLKSARNQELLEFNQATARQADTIKKLRYEEATLRGEIYRLDQPLVLEASVPNAESRYARESMALARNLEISIRGVNFGPLAGRVIADRLTPCSSDDFRKENLQMEIVGWSTSRISVRMANRLLRQTARCKSNLSLWIGRSDGKLSNNVTVGLPQEMVAAQ